MLAAHTIFTVGHSTRTEQELLALLGDANVQTLADVRAIPSSRRNPQYNRASLNRWLPAAGIEYVHLPELGGRRAPLKDSPNRAWRERAFQGYADHLGSPEFAAGLRRLERLARDRRTTVMCAEALWWRCHRRLIADALTVRGWRVEHLGIGERPVVHELPEFAVLQPDGRLIYPPAQSALFGA